MRSGGPILLRAATPRIVKLGMGSVDRASHCSGRALSRPIRARSAREGLCRHVLRSSGASLTLRALMGRAQNNWFPHISFRHLIGCGVFVFGELWTLRAVRGAGFSEFPARGERQ